MRLTMKERKTVTKALSKRYRQASKAKKGLLLDEFVEATGYNRCYARRLLREHGQRVWVAPGVAVEGDIRVRPKRAYPHIYGEQVRQPLKKIWEMMDFMNSKCLAAAMQEVVPRLVKCKELRVKKCVQKQLLQISPATIDRLLKPEREKHTLKGRAHTKPGSLLKHQIPIRTFSDWDDQAPGFFEMDLVGHDGGSTQGDYCFTLDMVDVATGWTEQVAVRNKARIWVFEALQEARKRLPFVLLGLDSDNGSEFINNNMKDYCDKEKITFTRTRPFRKNDNCYVEQKNWSVVRRYVGYARYETPEACAKLNELYSVLRDFTNFFVPSMKLKDKTRDGAKVTKRHHVPKTPYQRLLESKKISKAVKQRLKERYEQLNPAALWRQIRKLQKQLDKLATRRPKQEPVK